METQYYVKDGRRYIPVDSPGSFPSDGIWLVEQTGSGQTSRCIVKLGDAPQDVGSKKLLDEVVERKRIYDSVVKLSKKFARRKTINWDEFAKDLSDTLIK
jgi:hypothetical protein